MLRKHTQLALVALVLGLVALPVLAQATGTVNINTASSEQLQLLPRVGPSVATRIVEFRDTHGKFQQIEDLLLVQGIGEKTFELLMPYLSASGETTLNEKVRVSQIRASRDSE